MITGSADHWERRLLEAQITGSADYWERRLLGAQITGSADYWERRRPACLSAKRETISRTCGARAGGTPALPATKTLIASGRSCRDRFWGGS
jgi:hypothetical protein